MNSNQPQPLRSQAAESAVATRTTWQTPSLACLGTVANLTAGGSKVLGEMNNGGQCKNGHDLKC